MSTERTQWVSRRYLEYLRNHSNHEWFKGRSAAPVDALTFERVELSDKDRQPSENHQWLTSYINSLSEEEVAAKMKSYRDGFLTIDDAVIDKLLMEIL